MATLESSKDSAVCVEIDNFGEKMRKLD